jgi:hypothetical protein
MIVPKTIEIETRLTPVVVYDRNERAVHHFEFQTEIHAKPPKGKAKYFDLTAYRTMSPTGEKSLKSTEQQVSDFA